MAEQTFRVRPPFVFVAEGGRIGVRLFAAHCTAPHFGILPVDVAEAIRDGLSEAIDAAKTQPLAPAEPFGGNQSAQGTVGARRREDGYQPEPEGSAS